MMAIRAILAVLLAACTAGPVMAAEADGLPGQVHQGILERAVLEADPVLRDAMCESPGQVVEWWAVMLWYRVREGDVTRVGVIWEVLAVVRGGGRKVWCGAGWVEVGYFHGRRLDRETGLYCFRNRYYDPVRGRWLSRDPKGLWGDQNQLGNGYGFVGANAINGLDPYGLQEIEHPDWATLKEQVERYLEGINFPTEWLDDFAIEDIKLRSKDAEAYAGKKLLLPRRYWRKTHGSKLSQAEQMWAYAKAMLPGETPSMDDLCYKEKYEMLPIHSLTCEQKGAIVHELIHAWYTQYAMKALRDEGLLTGNELLKEERGGGESEEELFCATIERLVFTRLAVRQRGGSGGDYETLHRVNIATFWSLIAKLVKRHKGNRGVLGRQDRSERSIAIILMRLFGVDTSGDNAAVVQDERLKKIVGREVEGG